MSMQIILLLGLAAFVFLPVSSARAQERDLSPGLHYTTIYNKPIPRPAPPEEPVVERPSVEKPVAAGEAESETIKDESTESRIWNKYKALATGTAEGESGESQKKSSEQHRESPDGSKENPARRASSPPAIKIEGPKSSVAELIGRWQEQKEQQKDMRSKSFKVPEYLIKGERAGESRTKKNPPPGTPR